MEAEIINFLAKKGWSFVPIKDEKNLEIIHNLLINNTLSEIIPDEDIVYLYFGVYYQFKEDEVKMLEYYSKAINKKNQTAIQNLYNYLGKKSEKNLNSNSTIEDYLKNFYNKIGPHYYQVPITNQIFSDYHKNSLQTEKITLNKPKIIDIAKKFIDEINIIINLYNSKLYTNSSKIEITKIYIYESKTLDDIIKELDSMDKNDFLHLSMSIRLLISKQLYYPEHIQKLNNACDSFTKYIKNVFKP